MENMNGSAVGVAKRKALPLVLVLIMALVAGVAMLYAATANGYESNSYTPTSKRVAIEKQVEPGVDAGDKLFKFEMTVSPQYIDDKLNQIDKAAPNEEDTYYDAQTYVRGVICDVTYKDGKAELTPSEDVVTKGNDKFINNMPVAYGRFGRIPGTVQLDFGQGTVKDANGNVAGGHTVTFYLKAGQRIVFPDMRFAHKDANCVFVVNEILDEGSPYEVSKILAPGSIAKATDVYFSESEQKDDGVFKKHLEPFLTDSGAAAKAQSSPIDYGSEHVYGVDGEDNADLLEHTPELIFYNDKPVYRSLSVSKTLEGIEQADTSTYFNFELILSPKYLSTPEALVPEGKLVTGTVYASATDQKGVTKDYQIANNKIKFSLKAGESISFSKLPYIDKDGPYGTFIVREVSATTKPLGEGDVVDSYIFDSTEMDADVRLDAQEAGLQEEVGNTGCYGQFYVDKEAHVKFVNGKKPVEDPDDPAPPDDPDDPDDPTPPVTPDDPDDPTPPVVPEDVTKSFSVTKSLSQGTTYKNERFLFEAIISPETIGAQGDLITGSTVTGTVTDAKGRTVSTTSYVVGKDHAVYFNLKADQKMTFTGIKSSSMDADELIVVNEVNGSYNERANAAFYVSDVLVAGPNTTTSAQKQQYADKVQAGALIKFNDGKAALTFVNATPNPAPPEEPQQPTNPTNPTNPANPANPTDDDPLRAQETPNPNPTPGSYLTRTPTNMSPVGEEILDDGVPLASFVQTGDENTKTFILLFTLEGIAIIALIVLMILKRHDKKLALERARHGA